MRLVVDTGASYTTLPVEVVEALGCDTHHPLRTVRIVAANGIIVAPVVALPWFHCLGQRLSNFSVAAHTLPTGTFVDGLLGMDFLSIEKIPRGKCMAATCRHLLHAANWL